MEKIQVKSKRQQEISETLLINDLNEVIVSPINNEAKTQSSTPIPKIIKADSYTNKVNTLEKSVIQQNEKDILSPRKAHLTFRPSILYGDETNSKDKPYFAKILNEFLIHAIQSITIMQRFGQVPQQLINMKRVTLPPTTSISLN